MRVKVDDDAPNDTTILLYYTYTTCYRYTRHGLIVNRQTSSLGSRVNVTKNPLGPMILFEN
jgi:hypothetical protein